MTNAFNNKNGDLFDLKSPFLLLNILSTLL